MPKSPSCFPGLDRRNHRKRRMLSGELSAAVVADRDANRIIAGLAGKFARYGHRCGLLRDKDGFAQQRGVPAAGFERDSGADFAGGGVPQPDFEHGRRSGGDDFSAVAGGCVKFHIGAGPVRARLRAAFELDRIDADVAARIARNFKGEEGFPVFPDRRDFQIVALPLRSQLEFFRGQIVPVEVDEAGLELPPRSSFGVKAERVVVSCPDRVMHQVVADPGDGLIPALDFKAVRAECRIGAADVELLRRIVADPAADSGFEACVARNQIDSGRLFRTGGGLPEFSRAPAQVVEPEHAARLTVADQDQVEGFRPVRPQIFLRPRRTALGVGIGECFQRNRDLAPASGGGRGESAPEDVARLPGRGGGLQQQRAGHGAVDELDPELKRRRVGRDLDPVPGHAAVGDGTGEREFERTFSSRRILAQPEGGRFGLRVAPPAPASHAGFEIVDHRCRGEESAGKQGRKQELPLHVPHFHSRLLTLPSTR